MDEDSAIGIDELLKWVSDLSKSDNICLQYYDKIKKAKTKKRIVDIAIDSNGCSFLCDMESKNMLIPYSHITSIFSSFINGNYTSFHGDKDRGYTSSIYCCYQGDIDVKSSLVTLLGCKANVYVKENSVVQIYADRNCEISVGCPSSSKAIVHYWGNREPEYSGNVELIKE